MSTFSTWASPTTPGGPPTCIRSRSSTPSTSPRSGASPNAAPSTAIFSPTAGPAEDPRHKPGRALEPTTILGAVAAATEHIGLIGTLSTTFNDPWELAYRIASLDYVSGGRVAWNVVTTYAEDIAGNFGLTELPDRDTRYRRAAEFVDAVNELWASARNRTPVRFDGEFFTIAGQLPVPPPRKASHCWCRPAAHRRAANSPDARRTRCSPPN